MKNVILLNSRSLHLYDFEELKKNYSIKISILIFEEQAKHLPDNIKNFVDKIYIVPPKIMVFDPIFSEEGVRKVLHHVDHKAEETWLVASDELHNLPAAFLRACS